MRELVIDCGACAVRGRACSDCVVSSLLGQPGAQPVAFADDEVRALRALSEAGMLPPLRLVRAADSAEPERWRASG